MIRFFILLLNVWTCCVQLAAEEKSASQRFVVRVVPKARIEQPTLVEQRELVQSDQPAKPSSPVDGNPKPTDKAIRLSVAGNAGLIIHFEFVGSTTKASNPRLKVGVSPDAAESWDVRINNDGSARVTSRGNGHGCAIFHLSTDANIDELEIIATVICKE